VLISLKGALPSPHRTVDISQLTSWLTLRAVEQQSRQIDAMERAAHDAAIQASPTSAASGRPAVSPAPVAPDAPSVAPGNPDSPAGARAPALPPPVDITPDQGSRIAPRIAPRAEGTAPPRGGPRPPGLLGAQN
jgi:large subunit ribosomal protein L24